MSITPTGIYSLSMFYAQQTLAASPTLQALFGVTTAAAAATKILTGETDEHADGDIRPRIILDILDEGELAKTSDTGWLADDTVEATFEIPIPADLQGDANFRNARLWFYNQVGGVIADVQKIAGTAGYLNIIGISRHTIGRADPKDNDGPGFFVCILDLKWQG